MELLRFSSSGSVEPPRPADLQEVQAVSGALRRQVVGVRAVEEVAPWCAHERYPGRGGGGCVASPAKPRVGSNAAFAGALGERSRRVADRDGALAVDDHGPRAEFAVELPQVRFSAELGSADGSGASASSPASRRQSPARPHGRRATNAAPRSRRQDVPRGHRHWSPTSRPYGLWQHPTHPQLPGWLSFDLERSLRRLGKESSTGHAR